MNLKEMYNTICEMNNGNFVDRDEELNEEILEFLDNNNEYDIDIKDLLDLIDNYLYSEYAEIAGIYNSVEETASEMLDGCYDIPEFLEFY